MPSTGSTGTIRIARLNGRNGVDSPLNLPDDMAQEILNIDGWQSDIGAKRNGTVPITVSFSSGGPFAGSVGSVLRHIPGDDETAAEFWAIDGNSTSRFARMAGAATFADITLKDNLAAASDALNVFGASMPNGFFFLAYKSGQNRTYVWDPTLSKVRRVGLATPGAAPTGATDGGAGLTFSRVYRVRWVDVSGSDVRRMSEASATLSMSITDDAGYTVTRPTAASEDETHWDLEAANTTAGPWYRIARTAIATTTFDDTNATIPTTNPSPADGINFPPPGAKFVLATDARLIWAGHYGVTGGYVTGKTSRIWFSPVLGDNDIGDWERIPTGRYLDVEAAITALAGPLQGVIYVFSFRRIWKLVPTGDPTAPYAKFSISHAIGCVRQSSIVYGEDEQGNPCIYFMSHRGPYRLGPAGLQYLGTDIQELLDGVDLQTACHGLYHGDKKQVYYWYSSTGATNTNSRLRFDVQRGQPEGGGSTVRGGWYRDSGTSCNAYGSVMFSVTLGATMSRRLKPYISQSDATGRIWRCDVEGTYTDNSVGLASYIITKEYAPAGIGMNFQTGPVYAVASALESTPNDVLIIGIGQDFVVTRTGGSTVDTSETATLGTTTFQHPKFDSLRRSGCGSVAYKIGDDNLGSWNLEAVEIPYTVQEPR